MDATWFYLIVVLGGVFILGGILFAALGRPGAGEPMTETTAEMIGPEYTTGSSFESKELYAAVPTPSRQHLRVLTPDERHDISDRWRVLQASYVDDPEGVTKQVDVLARELLSARGYAAADLDVETPGVVLERSDAVDDYQAARTLLSAYEIEPEGTEQLEKAMNHYRSLFEELLQAPPAAA